MNHEGLSPSLIPEPKVSLVGEGKESPKVLTYRGNFLEGQAISGTDTQGNPIFEPFTGDPAWVLKSVDKHLGWGNSEQMVRSGLRGMAVGMNVDAFYLKKIYFNDKPKDPYLEIHAMGLSHRPLLHDQIVVAILEGNLVGKDLESWFFNTEIFKGRKIKKYDYTSPKNDSTMIWYNNELPGRFTAR